jgi:hypothetical protein
MPEIITPTLVNTGGMGKVPDVLRAINAKFNEPVQREYFNLSMHLTANLLTYDYQDNAAYGTTDFSIDIDGESYVLGIPANIVELVELLNNLDIGWFVLDTGFNIIVQGFHDFGDITQDSTVIFDAGAVTELLNKATQTDINRALALRISNFQNNAIHNFYQLDDTFTYPGNGLRIPMVNSSESALIPVNIFGSNVLAVKVASTVPLTATYNNGASGVGATITLTSGNLNVMDTITLSDGDTFLYKDAANKIHNGVYIRNSSTVATRTTNSDAAAEFDPQVVIPSQGTQSGQSFTQQTDQPVVGTDEIEYDQQGKKNAWVYNGNSPGAIKWLGTKNNLAVPFRTNKTERMRLFETGELGIGITSSPLGLFHVKGTTANDTASAVYVTNSTPATLFTLRNDGSFTLGLSATNTSASVPNASVVVGRSANVNAEAGISIGLASVGGYYSISMGVNATTSGAYTSIAMGTGAIVSATAGNCIAIGHDASVLGAGDNGIAIGADARIASGKFYGIAIGGSAQVNQDYGVSVGRSAIVNHANSQAWGFGATTTATHQLLIGGVAPASSWIENVSVVYNVSDNVHATYFRTSSPESAQTGNPGDMAYVNDGTNGFLYLKYLGTGNTGWVALTSAGGISAASETVAGIAEIATQVETDAGTDDTRIVSPLKLFDWWYGNILLHSITFGGGDLSVEAGSVALDETLGTLYTAFIDKPTTGTLEIGKNNTGTGNATTINIGAISTNLAVNIGTLGANTITFGSSASTLYAGASLLASAASKDLGSTSKPFRDLYLYAGGTFGTHYLKLTGAPTGSRVLTLPDATDTLVGKATTDTLTNKRITRRVATLTDAATVTIATDSYDGGILTSLSQATLLANPTGTPTNFQLYVLRIKSAAAQTLTYDTQFRGSTDLPLPAATTGSSKTDYFMFQWNSADNTWDILSKNFSF